MSPEALERQRGELDAAEAAGLDIGDYRVKQALDKKGLPWTRDNYLWEMYRGEWPDPDDWDESYLPADLQDWEAGPPRNA
jgi:hypothetical protein